MKLLVRLLPGTLPVFVRRRLLDQLFAATAQAFGSPVPALDYLSNDGRLRAYARFTSRQAEQALRSGRDLAQLKTRLYRNAVPLGAKARRWLGVRAMDDVMAVGQALYRAIGVEMQGDAQGNLVVQRCYFSRFYSAPVCGLISALDDGVFSGLSGGRRLVFTERITEGCALCRAKLELIE